VVVSVGLTTCVPPLAANLYVLPFDPVTVTVVEWVALTVKVVELPSVIVLDLAVMLTVGFPDASTVMLRANS